IRWMLAVPLTAVLGSTVAPPTFAEAPPPLRRGGVQAQVGGSLPGVAGPVTFLGKPVVDGGSEVGFVAAVDAGGFEDHVVWVDGAVVHRNSAVTGATLTGGEPILGVSDDGRYVFAPQVDGNDAVWSHLGLLAVEGDPAVGLPPSTLWRFHERPQVTAAGRAYWVAGYDEPGGQATDGTVLYTSVDADPGAIAAVLRSGDVVDGLEIAGAGGVGLEFHLSRSGGHHIHVLDTTEPVDRDGALYVDGTIVARQGSPVGDGTLWDQFDTVVIDDGGTYLVSGNTTAGDPLTDEFIAVDGAIAVREGDRLAGVDLSATATVRGLAMDSGGRAAFVWTAEGNRRQHAFFSCSAADPASARNVVSTGDGLDADGDGAAEGTVTDLGFDAIALGDDGRLWIRGAVDFGAGSVDALFWVVVPTCGSADPVINEVDYGQPGAEGADFVELYNPGSVPVSLAGYELVLVDGAGGGVYNVVDLTPLTLNAGGHRVVCGRKDLPFPCDLIVAGGGDWIQEGNPDAVALRRSGALVDTVSYGGDSPPPYTEGSGVGLGDDLSRPHFGISRLVDGLDTDRNNVDFAGRCHTPGTANTAESAACEPVPVELLSLAIE
ncbi:MAG: lamin tail domain-containing protein, partial [Acidobacteriota bacterium]